MAAGERQTHQVETEARETTRAFWGQREGVLLSPDAAREVNRNVTRFFDLLAEWDQAAETAEEDTAP